MQGPLQHAAAETERSQQVSDRLDKLRALSLQLRAAIPNRDPPAPHMRKYDEYIRSRLAEHDEQRQFNLSPDKVRLKKALAALSPRSMRAYRFGPPFDPFLGTCPYPFP